MDNKNKKIKDEQTTNRVLTVFVSGALGLWLLSYLFRAYDIPTSMHTALTLTYILLGVFSALFIAGLIWFLVSRKKGTFNSGKVINGRFVACLSAVAMLCFTALILNFDLGIKFVYFFVSAVVILYLIYAVYQRTFFWLTVSEVLNCLVLYCAGKFAAKTVFIVISLLVCALSFAAVLCAKRGALNLGSRKIIIYGGSRRQAVTASAIIFGASAIASVLCFFIPVVFVIYAIAAFLVCCAVYFTFRLI